MKYIDYEKILKDKNLTNDSKALLYLIIKNLDIDACLLSNIDLSKELDCCERTIRRQLKVLIDNKYIALGFDKYKHRTISPTMNCFYEDDLNGIVWNNNIIVSKLENNLISKILKMDKKQQELTNYFIDTLTSST